MPKVTFSATPCVWITIDGESTGGWPNCPNDDGVVGRFNKWLAEQLFFTVRTPGHSGGGSWAHAFYPEDAPKVIEWLRFQGLTEGEQR